MGRMSALDCQLKWDNAVKSRPCHFSQEISSIPNHDPKIPHGCGSCGKTDQKCQGGARWRDVTSIAGGLRRYPCQLEVAEEVFA